MTHRNLTAVSAVLTALAIPAIASAHERPNVASVKSHTVAASVALDRVQGLVGSDNAAAAVAYAKSRVETHAASSDARALTARPGRGAARRAARAHALLATLQDDNADAFAALLAQDPARVELAKALAASTKGRGTALSTLSGLLPRLPAAAHAGIARAIEAINADGEGEVTELAGLAAGDDVAADVQPWVSLALGYATQGMAHALDQLTGVLDRVPAQARPHVEAALDRVTTAFDRVRGILGGIFGAPTSSDGTAAPTTGPPVPGGLPIPSNLPIPAGLPIPAFLRG